MVNRMMWESGTGDSIIASLGLGIVVGILITEMYEFGWASIASFLGTFGVIYWLYWSERHSLAKKFRVRPHVAVGIVRRVLKEERLSFRQDGSKFLIDSPKIQIRIWLAYRRSSFDRFSYSRVIIGPDVKQDLLFVNRLRDCFDEAFKSYESYESSV